MAAIRAAYGEGEVAATVDAVAAAEPTLAMARADGLAKIQASPAKLAPNQVAALIAAGGVFRAGGGGRGQQTFQLGGGTIPNVREAQTAALTRMSTDLMPLTRS